MNIIGIIVITIVMASAVAGAIASLRDSEKGLGKEFLEGLHAIGYIFIPVAGIMAAVPFLAELVEFVFGKAYGLVAADPAMAATSFIAVDMGGYHLAHRLAATPEAWIMAMMAGTMAGATIVFSIPVGLAMLQKRDHKYMALGVMAGLLSIPIGVLISSLLLMLLGPTVRIEPSTTAEATHALQLGLGSMLLNLLPLTILFSGLALGLRLFPDAMIRGFMGFGRFMDVALKLILAASIVEYFTWIFYGTGVFTLIFGGWGFDPILADYDQIFGHLKTSLPLRTTEDLQGALKSAYVTRALEVAGYIGMMLAGAFPMVYLIRKHLARPMEVVGKKIGLASSGAAGLLAAIANILAMFRLVQDMRAKDKVLVIAFAVCSAFLFGDHLAFTANFQPNLLVPVMLGKLSGGICGFAIAYWLCVPKALDLEKKEVDEHVEGICALFPGLEAKKITFKRLGGGLTNFNYLIRAGDESYVLRISAPATGLLGIDRQRELACSEAAAAAGVGPEVYGFLSDISFLPGHTALLVGFCPGRTLETKDFAADGLLPRVAQALRRCHDHPISESLGEFCPFQAIRDYHRLALEKKADLPADLPLALERLAAIEKEVAGGQAPCLCHNDLLAANFMDDGVNLRIIDWEYGGVGDRFFDLGNLAVNLQLTEAQERTLLASYFGAARPEDLRRLRLMRLVSDMREATWSYLQSRISTIDVDYPKRGREHLDRFLRASQSI